MNKFTRLQSDKLGSVVKAEGYAIYYSTYLSMEGGRVHNSYMRCSIFIMLCWLFYVSTFKSALFYVASFIMLCLIFYVPSDKFQSALCYDAMFNMHYAIRLWWFFYVHRSISLLSLRSFRYFRFIIYELWLLQAYCCIYKVQCLMTLSLLLLCHVK